MSSKRSPDEITRQLWSHFDGNSAEENRHAAMRDVRAKEVAEEHKHRSNRDTDTYKIRTTTDVTSDLGDMGENDSSGG